MERLLWQNLLKGKWVFGGFFGLSLVLQQGFFMPNLRDIEVFGPDGNGGRMLKIITNLTDEEIARLKFQRRMFWHWPGTRKYSTSGNDHISDQELSHRGIEIKQEPFIEYQKRPPHDKYL
jgi:hypothetical protein